MQQNLEALIQHLRGAWRFRWWAVITAWIIAIGGFTAACIMSDQYESRARLYVDQDSVLRPLLQGIAVERDVGSQIAMMSSVLNSRPTLERVVNETGMYKRALNPRQLEKMYEDLAKEIVVDNGHNGNNTLTISYTDPDPVMAQKVVRSLLDAFLERTVGIKRSDSGMASEFLGGQIKEYEKRLTEAERKLADFKKEHLGLLPGQSGDFYTRLQDQMTGLETLRSKYRQLDGRRAALVAQLSGTSTSRAASGVPSLIDQQLSQARADLERLLVQYTDKHPQVVALRETITKLEQEKAAGGSASRLPAVVAPTQGENGNNNNNGGVVGVNPVYQTIGVSLAQTEAEMGELRGQIADQERQVADLHARVNTLPDIEAQLVQLNRDYETNRAQHAALLQRLESARISGQAEESADDLKFRVVEPPVVSALPIKPNRPLLLTAALLAALLGGAAVAVGLHQIKPAYPSTTALAKDVKFPILGAITNINFDPVKRWYNGQTITFASSIGLLVVTYLAVLLVAQRIGLHGGLPAVFKL
jgi:polysaccharide chain length determinant protein (PEP-CTERM system associated)